MMRTNKKAQERKIGEVIIVLILIAVVAAFIGWKLRPALFGTADEYSAKDTGAFADLDNDGVRNQFDQCPAKACTRKAAGEQIDSNPTSERYGCTDEQTPCGTSMECRQAATC